MVKKYKAELINITNLVENIYQATFKSVEKPFKYAPGQFLHLAIDEYDGSGQWPDSRCFSMQSSQNDDFITITFAAKGKFTQRMAAELKTGHLVWLKLPYGDLFSQIHTKKNVVFIAGGTGVTPYLSLFNNPAFENYLQPYLYLGLRNANFHLYKNELQKALQINNQLVCELIFEDINGKLSINSIFEKHGKDATYFISGPPMMISVFKIFLLNCNVLPENIKTDDWE